MTLDNNYIDYLIIHYNQKEFLINRSQFSSSISYHSQEELINSNEYYNDYILFGTTKIINFNLDKYLIDTFKADSDNSVKISIISESKQLSDQSQKLIFSKLKNNSKNISDSFIAITISSKAKIIQKSSNEHKSLTKVISHHLIKEGVDGCQFSNNIIQFYLNLDKIIFNTLYSAGELL